MTLEMTINGQSVTADDTFDVINPADKSIIAAVPNASIEQINEAVAAAKDAFPAWSALTYEQRCQQLMQLADAIEMDAIPLIASLTKEQGKPIKGFAELGAEFEFGGTLAWIKATASYDIKPEIIQDNEEARIELHRKPLGVIASITPWNYPLLITIWHIIPALLTGNTVVVKPSELTPLTVLKLGQIAKDILPAGVLNIISGDGETGAALTSHPDINKVVFTGSTATGKTIMKNAVDNLTRLTLELGGNDAAIVLDDADIEAIAPKIFATAFINNGQTCAAIKRLYVHQSVYDKLSQTLANMANSMKVGNGMNEDTDFGPLQNVKQFNLVKALAEDAKANGATFLSGGEVTDETGYFYPISIVTDIKDGTRLVDEEQFGPILPIISFDNVEEAIASANANSSGLGGSVWSTDIDKATEIAARLECGSVWVNNHAMVQPDTPFGGIKNSGFGVVFGEAGLKEFTYIQTMQIAKG